MKKNKGQNLSFTAVYGPSVDSFDKIISEIEKSWDEKKATIHDPKGEKIEARVKVKVLDGEIVIEPIGDDVREIVKRWFFGGE